MRFLRGCALAFFAAFISGCGLFWEDPYVDVTVTPLNWIEIHYYNATREPIRRVNVRITGSGPPPLVAGVGFGMQSALNKWLFNGSLARTWSSAHLC